MYANIARDNARINLTTDLLQRPIIRAARTVRCTQLEVPSWRERGAAEARPICVSDPVAVVCPIAVRYVRIAPEVADGQNKPRS